MNVQYRWIVVAFTMLMQVISFGSLVYSFALFVVPWANTFDISRTEVMSAIFILQIAAGIASPFIGRLLDEYGFSWLVPLGGLVLAIGFMLVSLATGMWQIILIYSTILPLAAILAGPLAAQTVITKWFGDQCGYPIGISAIGTSIGGFLMPLLCGALLAEFDWRITMRWFASLALFVIVPVAWLVLKPSPPQEADAESSEENPKLAPANQRIWTTREILCTRNFWLPAIAFLALNMCFGGVSFNLAAYAQDIGNSLSQAAWLISLLSFSMIAGKLLFGLTSDRLDHRMLYWIAAGLMSMGLVLIRGEPAYLLLCFCSILIGVASGGMLPLMGAIYSRRFGVASFGRVIGLVTLIVTVGGFGSLIGGMVYDATGSYDMAFIVFLFILIPSALGMSGLKK